MRRQIKALEKKHLPRARQLVKFMKSHREIFTGWISRAEEQAYVDAHYNEFSDEYMVGRIMYLPDYLKYYSLWQQRADLDSRESKYSQLLELLGSIQYLIDDCVIPSIAQRLGGMSAEAQQQLRHELSGIQI
jgi:hypothetical protein